MRPMETKRSTRTATIGGFLLVLLVPGQLPQLTPGLSRIRTGYYSWCEMFPTGEPGRLHLADSANGVLQIRLTGGFSFCR